jgi:hypothetical protein
MGRVEITEDNGSLVVVSPYDQTFVSNIKGLPASDRRWEPQRKAWLVDPRHARSLQAWIKTIYGENVGIQTSFTSTTPTLQTLAVWYLGACKDRGNENTAMAYLQNGSWGAVFPEPVLRLWFEGSAGAPTGNNLYSILGISCAASQEEIRTGFRRMALQWHPDRCKDPDAAEVFMKVQNAYSLLSNDDKRARYDAGLALEATIGKVQQVDPSQVGYRAPLRSGNILVEGRRSVGRIVVEKILAWDDIFNSAGQMMVSSWPMGSTQPVIAWV